MVKRYPEDPSRVSILLAEVLARGVDVTSGRDCSDLFIEMGEDAEDIIIYGGLLVVAVAVVVVVAAAAALATLFANTTSF